MNARSTEEAPSTAEPRLVVVMGVSGSGKSTIGPLLARALGCPFVEGDELHPRANIEKMSRGEPLTDADRAPWLAAIRARLVDAFERGQCIVIASSALKRAYRLELANGLPVTWVHLHGPAEVIRQRLERRAGHFMGAGMLRSQLATLEIPADAIVADITLAPDAVVADILAAMRGGRIGRVDRPANAAGSDDLEG